MKKTTEPDSQRRGRPCIALLCAGFALGSLAFARKTPPQAGSLEETGNSFVSGEPLAHWLVLEGVDGRGRRPFRADRVLARHLLDPAATLPRVGDELTGERGSSAWTLAEASAEGHVSVRGRGGYAHAVLDVPTARVVLARLEGATTLFVGGTPAVGDVYGYGQEGVGVRLQAGRNALFVTGVRGSFRLTLVDVESPLSISSAGLLAPDRTVPGPTTVVLGLTVHNLSLEPQRGLSLAAHGAGVLPTVGEPFELQPLESRRVPFAVALGEAVPGSDEATVVELELRQRRAPSISARASITVPHRSAAGLHRRTFVSAIDGSAQEFVLLPPDPAAPELADTDGAQRLLLSLHGASVHAWNQGASYAATRDLWIAVPTNRRPFGFDWQDQGRLDAYEVLARALEASGVARTHVVLSGHSMGGHGTWHLGANDPDGFAALGPSAGWRSFDTYGGRPEGELRELWHGADAASETEALLTNLRQLPTYILHSDQDESVPVAEALAMHELLRDVEAEVEVELHVEEGKGHWWDGPAPGADCLTWPPLLDFLREHTIPVAPRSIAFRTVDPGVDAVHHWLRVEQLERYGEAADVKATWKIGADGIDRIHVHSENVRAWTLLPPALTPGREVELRWNGAVLDGTGATALATVTGGRRIEGLAEGEKRPTLCGPLKRAFDRRFVLVVPQPRTADDPTLERARYDAGVWRYRGNGHAPILTDEQVLRRPEQVRGRNVILYGNADTNAAWELLVPATCPLRVESGRVTLDGATFSGRGVGALFVHPRADDGEALVAVLAGADDVHERLVTTLAPFVSGVGYPDFVVFDAEVLTAGDGGVRAAGWFDATWRPVRAR